MPAPQIASLPEFFTLSSGMKVRLTAIDPTTGALVAGVTISEVKIDVDPVIRPGAEELAVPSPLLVPEAA